MRRLLLSVSVAAAVLAVAQPAEAQFRFGAQSAMITSIDEIENAPTLNNKLGIGPRIVFSPPAFPIGGVAEGVYYFPDDAGLDFSFMTYSLAATFSLPFPTVSPYAIGGWEWRRSSFEGNSETENGAILGVGVTFNLAVSLFLEGTYGFTDDVDFDEDFDNKPLVIKAGVMFGG
jgi:opacity protein-like surface antigen